MVQRWGGWYWHLGLASFLGMSGAISLLGNCTLAQITPDSTLGAESSVVTPTNIDGLPTQQIDGGATRGANLFHSFEQFSVPTGGAAYFNNALNIQNIISRVTGSSVSNIDGLLRANGTANLFLLNPNGIIFGPNAWLNIGGSFLGSTASAVNFADGTQFSATAPQATPLLTVSVPIGLQYGGSAGSILNQSRATNSSGEVVGLQVQPGETLALLGGDVRLDGGNLQAPGGRVELGGLAGAGIVEIEGQQSEGAFGLASLHFPDAFEREDVRLTNLAFVDVVASGGGSIAINARNIDMSGGSVVSGGLETNSGFLGATAGDITLNATGAIAIANSDILNYVRTGAVGKGGSIDITTGSLSVRDGAQLAASTFEQGDAGSVNIHARSTVSFDGVSSDGLPSAAGSTVESGAVGNGGSINITTGSLSLTNGAELLAYTSGRGNAGSVNINALDTVSSDGVGSNGFSSGVFNTVDDGAVGNGGKINITTGSLVLTNGAKLTVASRTLGQGDAGSVTIHAGSTVSLDGEGSNGSTSGISSIVEPGAVGNGGGIDITTGSLSVTNGAQLSASTFGQGDAGSVNIHAENTVSFDGVGSDRYSSAAFSNVESGAVGNGGSINITTGALSMTNGAQLLTNTHGQGNAGSVNINARDTVSFDGVNSNGLSSVALSTVEEGAVGNGGGINITTGLLSVTNGAGLTASSIGSGAAGNIKVEASSIRLDNEAFLSSDTPAEQGNIILNSEDLVLRRGSNITTNATGTATGGNITIDTGVIAALEDSDITANAEEARGGQVIIDAQGLFGTEFRNQLTPLSDITATGGSPELSGTVEINTPDVDPSQGLVELPAELVDASGLIVSGCGAGGRQEESKFIVTGRGGLPLRPGDAHISHYPTGSVRSIPSSSPSIDPTISVKGSDPSTNLTRVTAPTSIVEATGWVINNKGEVVLTAHAPNATPNIPWMPPATCHGATSPTLPLALSTR